MSFFSVKERCDKDKKGEKFKVVKNTFEQSMPRQLGLHTFHFPLFSFSIFSFPSFKWIFTWGKEKKREAKKHFHIKCAHNHMHGVHRWEIIFSLSFYYQHTKQSEKGNFLPFFRLFSESDRYAWKMYQSFMSKGSLISFLLFFSFLPHCERIKVFLARGFHE